MSFIDAVVHILNFFAPAAVVGALAAFLTKLLWRRELASVSWIRLASWSCVACAVVLVAGLLISGRDGKMGTYAAMVVASAAALWWPGWGQRARKG